MGYKPLEKRKIRNLGAYFTREEAELIENAAKLQVITKSEFIRNTLISKAKSVIRRQSRKGEA